MARYVPPRQGKASQIFDVIVLLVLAIGALYAPLFLRLAGSSKTDVVPVNPTWESLGQNATMVERWIQLGYETPAEAAAIIAPRFDYSFNLVTLVALIVVIVGYYVMMLRFSEIEYRQVINEKFGEK